MPPDVLFSDASLLVLNKPAGLLSVPGRGEDKQDCLLSRLHSHYPEALVVHRLDMATSGIILFARNKTVQRLLGDAFAKREVHKRYAAVVNGIVTHPESPWKTIDLPIAVDWPNRPLRIIDMKLGKPSVTRLQCIGHDVQNNTSRVVLEPETGRSHQLRIHMQAIGHCILGDALYAPPNVQARSPRLLLHADHIAFRHPVSGILMALDCPAEF
jgi:tRNA pseudouridine32 synthase/23S rRNA pseudouridine746 synthase